MITINARRSAILAMVGVTAGVASAVATPVAAHASAEAGSSADTLRPTSPAPVVTCTSWSDFQAPGGGVAHIPTATQGDMHWACFLGNGNANHAVFKLQDALNRCYGEHLDEDGIFGNRTEEALTRAQQKEGISADGKYGPESSLFLRWPTSPSETSPNCKRV